MANKYMKRYSISLVIRETQIKTTMIHHFILTKMALINRGATTNFSGNVEKLEPSSSAGRNVNWSGHFEKQFGTSSRS